VRVCVCQTNRLERDVVLQPVLGGREWTVGVAAGTPMMPVQCVFARDELFKPSGGTRGGEAIERDGAVVSKLQVSV
jgi:hypothetical protein